MIRHLVRLAALAAALSTTGLAAHAEIRLGVSAQDGSQTQNASDTFGPGVTRVSGNANEALANVGAGANGCLSSGNCNFIANINAATRADFNADGMRWRVNAGAVGQAAQASSDLMVTDSIFVLGPSPGLKWLDFKVRIEFDALTGLLNSEGGLQAGALYSFELGVFGGETGNDFQPYFSLTAAVDNYGNGPQSYLSVEAPGQTPFFSVVVPSVYETTFSMPVPLGSSGAGFFDFVLMSSAGAYANGGIGTVESFNSAYVGLSAVGATLSSANGYTYTGYTGDGGPIAAVPEPSSVALMLLGGALLAAHGTWRRRREQQAAGA